MLPNYSGGNLLQTIEKNICQNLILGFNLLYYNFQMINVFILVDLDGKEKHFL